MTHAQQLSPSSLAQIDALGFKYEHRPLIMTQYRKFALPRSAQYILSSASAIRSLIGKDLREADYWVIGPRTAQWAEQLLPHIAPWVRVPSSGPYSLKHVVNTLPDVRTTWLGSAQGLWRHQELWLQCPWLIPVVSHWQWSNINQARHWDWSIPAEITCHCQNAAITLSQLPVDPRSRIWLSSPRLRRYFPEHAQCHIISSDWLTQIAAQYQT